MYYEMTIPQFSRMLRNFEAILEKAAAHADAKKFEMGVLLHSRLAPDQFNLLRQIQITTDTAKLCVARLTGKSAPTHDDKETTWPELKSRIRDVIQYLGTITEADFAKADAAQITQPRWEGKHLTGQDYLVQHALPNFYFHLTTAYSILRHNGVEIGKKDYLGELSFKK